MSDEIVINVTSDPSINISAVDSNEEIALNPLTLNQGIISHSVTHQKNGSDELAHNLLGGLDGGQLSQYYHLTSGEYSNLVTGSVVRPNETGEFIINAQTGQFYANSNPSGFITGVDLSAYATEVYVTGISGGLQTQITTLDTATGNLNTRLTTAENDISILESATGTLLGYINSNDSDISTLQSATGNLDSRINANDGDILSLQTATGQLNNYVINLQGVTGTFVLYSETGQFYANSNPSGFITGVDLSNYVLNSQTGNFIISSQTGQFYPNSNPSGFITGIDLSSYATQDYVTGISGHIQSQVTNLNSQTGSYVLNTETGIFYTNDNPSGFITGVDLSSYATEIYVTGVSGSLQQQITNLNNATGSYVLTSETGNFITTFETGQFYSNLNPSGFITGIDLSSYATQDYVTGISGDLQSQIINLNNSTGSYVLNTETGNFITTFETGQFYAASNPSGYITGVDLSNYVTTSSTGFLLTTGAADERYVDLTNTQTISGTKTFDQRPLVNGTGVLLIGEGSAPENVVYQTGDQTISGVKTFATGVNINGDLTVDTNVLYVDSTNNRVGINTSSPTAGYGLDVNGSVRSAGNLLLQGSIIYLNSQQSLTQGTNSLTLGNATYFTSLLYGNTSTISHTFRAGDVTMPANLTVDTDTLFVDATNNEVGIGTATPTAKLEVNGTTIIQDDATFNGTENTMPNQTLDAGDNSIMTQKLTYSDIFLNGPTVLSLGAATRNRTSTSLTTPTLTQGFINLSTAFTAIGDGVYAVWDYFLTVAGSGGDNRFNRPFSLIFTLNGILNLNGNSILITLGTTDLTTGLLTGRGIALLAKKQSNAFTTILQIHDGTTLETLELDSTNFNVLEGISKLAISWDGVSTLKYYASSIGTGVSSFPRLIERGSLTHSSTMPNTAGGERDLKFYSLALSGPLDNRGIRIREAKFCDYYL